MRITPSQQSIALKAISNAHGGGTAWAEGGPLSQIALLSGNTLEDLRRWDSNEAGPLSIAAVQEADLGLHGWPLTFLEAFEAAWRGGAPPEALKRLVRDAGAPAAPTTPASPVPVEGEDAVAYDGKERRGAFTVAVDIKSILFVITVIAPLLGMSQWLMSVRQDVRSNTLQLIQMKTTNEALETRVANTERDYQRSKLLFCAARDDTDTIRARELPDIGC